MADVPVRRQFRLVYLVFSTLFGLLSPGAAGQCFGNVARVLEPDRMFVVECFVPDLAQFDRDQRVRPGATEDSAILDCPVTTRRAAHHHPDRHAGGGLLRRVRYAGPANWA
jgi:hypothetical protein